MGNKLSTRLHGRLFTWVRFIFLCILFLGTRSQTHAQKSFETREQTWIGYIHQSRLTNKSGVWIDLHFRMTDNFVRQRTMAIARVAYVYHVRNHLRLFAGHAYANRYNQSGVNRIPEHRLWQQIQWLETKKGFNLSQALRIEQRFRRTIRDHSLGETYNFNWRFRYNVSFTIPLGASALGRYVPFLLAQNEILVNAGKSITYNYFDQNRSFLGLGYQFTKELNAHLGYLFIFQHEGAQARYLHLHVIRLFVSYNLDLRDRSD